MPSCLRPALPGRSAKGIRQHQRHPADTVGTRQAEHCPVQASGRNQAFWAARASRVASSTRSRKERNSGTTFRAKTRQDFVEGVRHEVAPDE